jgi:hypothetical protein
MLGLCGRIVFFHRRLDGCDVLNSEGREGVWM